MTAYWQRLSRMRPEQALIVFQSSLAAMAITPFGLWRLSQGQWGQGVFDLVLVVVLFGLAWLGREARWLRSASVGVASLYVLASLFVAYQFGPLGHLWFYPAMVAGYFIVRANEAVWLALLGLFAHMLLALRQGWTAEAVTFLATSLLVCIFIFAFSSRLRQDNRRLYTDSTVDSLTNAGNRRLLDDALAEVSADDYPGRPSVLMFDIDHFKQVNDTYGHAVGDLCLSRLASRVMSQLQGGQRLFRYGGEEFVVLLPDEPQQAAGLAERLRADVAQATLIRESAITISIGVAERLPGEAIHTWLRRVDDALYQAKQTGRNRVCLAQGKGNGVPANPVV
jgi:diguanylate cyclase (GGDEF)-like protein